MIDSTSVRVHQQVACGKEDQALGRSEGGLITKVHMVVDARGQPMRFILTGGQAWAVLQAVPLLSDVTAAQVIADKRYDTDGVLRFVRDMGAVAVIPPTSRRKVQR